MRVTLFVVLCAAVTASAAQTAPAPARITTRTAETIVAVWRCQDQLGVERSFARSPWKHHSARYRAAELNRWIIRRRACLDVLHARGQVLRRLQHGLAGSPMEGTEKELEAAGRRYGVSPYFIAAIAATESSLGAASCGHYNAWGLANCTGIWNVPAFRSWAEAYDYMARFLKSRWPSADTPYDYHGYAACTSCWGAKTESHMRRLFGVSGHTRY